MVVRAGPVFRIAVVSDIHYASHAEQQRPHYALTGIDNPLGRILLQAFRRYVWLREPFAHNHLLDQFIRAAASVDLVVANGDYSCDTAFVGVSDAAALQSVAACLQRLRRHFASRLEIVIGDHEFGKASLGGGLGGPRLASWRALQSELQLRPFWQREVGRWLLIGITSTLVAFPVFEPEALPDERAEWSRLREQHVQEIRQAFAALRPEQRVVLFCHDPTALPFLAQDDLIRSRLPQVERTVIGHLHTRVVLLKARLLTGMPIIRFLGTTPRRLSTALHQARHWRPFKVTLCPALAGTQLLKRGGYCTLEFNPEAPSAATFRHHHFPWNGRTIGGRADGQI